VIRARFAKTSVCAAAKNSSAITPCTPKRLLMSRSSIRPRVELRRDATAARANLAQDGPL